MTTVIHDAAIVTVDDRDSVHYDAAIAIEGNRIAAVAPRRSNGVTSRVLERQSIFKRRKPPTTRVDRSSIARINEKGRVKSTSLGPSSYPEYLSFLRPFFRRHIIPLGAVTDHIRSPAFLRTRITVSTRLAWSSAIAFAPQDALGGNFLNTPFESVATAMHVSAFSLKSLTMACKPLFPAEGAAIVGLTFDAQFAWPQYDWMGPAKAALEATSRYLARDLGKENIRCNLVSAGPLGSMAAKSIPGFSDLADT